MRTQEERDEQTLDIMSAILVAVLVWALPVVALFVLAAVFDAEGPAAALAALVALGFVATIVHRLR
ncbi:hypothetical protein [Nocardioides pyridinolyticus]